MQKLSLISLILSLLVFIVGCTNNSLEDLINISVSDISVSMDENPLSGDVIANINASIPSGDLTYELANQNPAGATAVTNNGDLIVADASLFDFETHPAISGEVIVASGTNSNTISFSIELIDVDETALSANSFEDIILPKPENGSQIGQLNASGPNPITFTITSESNPGAFSVNTQSGIITVENQSLFVRNSTITAIVEVADNEATINATITINTLNLWGGPDLTFEKSSGSNPNLESNQDRISSTVWITRANSGGEIYNANSESRATQNVSPAGTLWAIGTVDQIKDLQFQTFRRTVRPSQVRGQNLILFLENEQAYVPLRFTSWSSGGKQGASGGFTYIRSTPD